MTNTLQRTDADDTVNSPDQVTPTPDVRVRDFFYTNSHRQVTSPEIDAFTKGKPNELGRAKASIDHGRSQSGLAIRHQAGGRSGRVSPPEIWGLVGQNTEEANRTVHSPTGATGCGTGGADCEGGNGETAAGGAVTNAGVYMLKNLVNGDTYIGSSTDLKKRLNQHRTGIQFASHQNKMLLQSFVGIESVEFRILEFMPYQEFEGHESEDEFEKLKDLNRIQDKAIRQRERHWIQLLQPNLNRKPIVKGIVLSELPVGAP